MGFRCSDSSPLSFVVATFKLRPDLPAVAQGLVPKLPEQDIAQYLFIAVSILGALLCPYLFYFYSSGAVEDKWDESDLGIVIGLWLGWGWDLGVSSRWGC